MIEVKIFENFSDFSYIIIYYKMWNSTTENTDTIGFDESYYTCKKYL